MPNLIKKNNSWRVAYTEARESKSKNFSSIEEAAEFLLKLKINDDEIDNAIIAIETCNIECDTIAALFKDDGSFSHLDVS